MPDTGCPKPEAGGEDRKAAASGRSPNAGAWVERPIRREACGVRRLAGAVRASPDAECRMPDTRCRMPEAELGSGGRFALRGVTPIGNRPYRQLAVGGAVACRRRSADLWSAVSRVSNPPGPGEPLAGADWKSAIRQADSLRYEVDGGDAFDSTRGRVRSSRFGSVIRVFGAPENATPGTACRHPGRGGFQTGRPRGRDRLTASAGRTGCLRRWPRWWGSACPPPSTAR
jgi:hypothetical protein